MIEMPILTGVLALTAILVGAQTPDPSAPRVDHDSAPLFFAFHYVDVIPVDDALGVLSPSVRRAVEARLKKRGACKPRYAMPTEGEEIWKELAFKHRALECAIVALVNRPGVQREAAAYAKDAVLAYEWEGFSGGPIGEAEFAQAYFDLHPRTALGPYLLAFLLHRYRCAFEAAAFEGQPGLQPGLAEQYRRVWARIERLRDPVVRALAQDIDGSRFVYLSGDQHPRTFRPAR